MKSITRSATEGNYELFMTTVYWFIFYNTIYFVLKYVSRHWGWPTYHPIKREIDKKYISWFFTLDNNYIEKIGTGRMISMLEKGIGTWAELMVGLVNNVTYHGILILFFCYVLSSIHILLIPILFGTIIGMLILLSFFNRWTISMRAEKIIEAREYSRMLVRCIMSKHETLANGRVSSEIQRLDDQSQRLESKDLRLDNPLMFMFNLPILILSLFRISLFIVA